MTWCTASRPLENDAWIPVIAQSELAFYRYRDPDSASGKAVALLRHGFGRHALHKKAETAAGRAKDGRRPRHGQ